MEERVHQLLCGKGGSYLLPMFWLHGEEEAVLREYMGAIYDSNIREVCVESRPHPDFCGEQWWHDLDIILDEARTRGMRIWLLDDSHFPTGYANGAYENAADEYCKQYLNFIVVDVDGPTPQIRVPLEKEMARLRQPKAAPQSDMDPEIAKQMGIRMPVYRVFDGDRIVNVTAYSLAPGGKLDKARDITEYVRDGVLTWDVPEGMWRIYAAYVTRNGPGQSDYMNVISAPSVKVLLDAVYEPHYARYSADFGKTIAGFFSDEPMIGNLEINYDPHCLIGTRRMYMPWSEEVESALEKSLGPDYLLQMPLLWHDAARDDQTAKVRYCYMDAVTELIRRNFSQQVGTWCENHGVEYIGHIVEDVNSSAKLGLSLGNYYRAQAGQHMAGIDDIGGCVMLAGQNRVSDGDYYEDGDFYHYYLAKMGSGLAHCDPKKQGRTMCELYGAYGWDFGVRSMKYLTDHMLLRGINRFVPHAFSAKAFPDPDCPPHFYAHGENPQYRYFGLLMQYAQRVAHLIDGGTPVSRVALLHCDEALWMGGGMLPQKVARELTEGQISFEVIPQDIFAEQLYTLEDTLCINGVNYGALIIPAYRYLTPGVAAFTRIAHEKGFPVYFVDKEPWGAVTDLSTALYGRIVPLENLSDEMKSGGYSDIRLTPDSKNVTFYHYKHVKDVYLISNENTGIIYEGEVYFPICEDACIYDAQHNCLMPLTYRKEANGITAHMVLRPFEPVIVVFGEKAEPVLERCWEKERNLTGFRVSLCEAKAYPNFENAFDLVKTENIAVRYPDFSGFIRYETVFDLDADRDCLLELEHVYECVTVWCNEKMVGMAYHPQYRFDLTGFVKAGENRLRMEVATTLDRKVRTILGEEGFRRSPLAQDPTGILGNVTLYSC